MYPELMHCSVGDNLVLMREVIFYTDAGRYAYVKQGSIVTMLGFTRDESLVYALNLEDTETCVMFLVNGCNLFKITLRNDLYMHLKDPLTFKRV